jgi:hypothetical protein
MVGEHSSSEQQEQQEERCEVCNLQKLWGHRCFCVSCFNEFEPSEFADHPCDPVMGNFFN